MKHIITMTGPSLAGKTQLCKILESNGFHLIKSFTTRPPRKGEIQGIDYDFITQEEFHLLKNKNQIIQETFYNQNYYGVSEKELNKGNEKPYLWIIAPQSLKQVQDYCEEKNYHLTKIFVTNSEDVIFKRLFERFKQDSTGSVDTYVNRLKSIISDDRQWTQDALEGRLQYDVIIKRFEEDNKIMIAQAILENNFNHLDDDVIYKKNKMKIR